MSKHKGKRGKRKSVMDNRFSRAPQANIQRSSFDRSHGLKTTFDSGWLVPIYVDEALPGDTFNLSLTALGRMATPIFPIMDNMFLETFFFAVPIRLVWDNWQKFNGEQANPNDSVDFTVPQIVPSPGGSGYLTGSLSDYFGLPTRTLGITNSALWHRAYNLIYNEWFRDQNLIDSVVVDTDDGPDDEEDYQLLRRGKRHDYFTSCLPWPQKGASVTVPIGTVAPVSGIGIDSQVYQDQAVTASSAYETEGTASVTYADYAKAGGTFPSGINAGILIEEDPNNAGFPNIYADLSNATAATINQLRQSFQIQRLLERDARGGTRYTEIIKSHFGVTSPDARLQRPEYLGGGSTPLNVSAVSQTSSTDGTSPQGNLAAYGTVVAYNHGFNKSFTEHCILIGLVNARADLTYQQGMNRMFSRLTRYDFYWPALAHIGEQAVLQKEIFSSGVGLEDDVVFGYQERYAEYRYKPSMVTGLFRSNATGGSLDAWHLSQDFASAPTLNESFINDDPPVDRVIAVPSEPHFLYDSYVRLKCARPMPTYSVPGMIDHF